jgi:hypothetical protein
MLGQLYAQLIQARLTKKNQKLILMLQFF